MKPTFNPLFLVAFSAVLLIGCDDEEPKSPVVETPATYSFEREGASTVAYGGQTTRLKMVDELLGAMKTPTQTKENLLDKFANENNPFADAELNASSKSVKSKVAASEDYFSTNTVVQGQIQAQFSGWMEAQAEEVFPDWGTSAAPGVAGEIFDNSSERHVNEQGLEYDQMVAKGLIGALVADQILNNYLSTSVLDAGTNRAENDNEVLVEGKNYTNMEHKWDEAFGYVYGTVADIASPNDAFDEDNLLFKYVGRLESDEDFKGIADELLNAFKLGRKAIVLKNYPLRDSQAEIIRNAISKVIGVRAVHYLRAGADRLPEDRTDELLYGPAFHALSEGYGFIYSLQFTRRPNSSSPYFTKDEVEAMLADLLDDGSNGLWDVEKTTLSALATQIADRFDFTEEQAD